MANVGQGKTALTADLARPCTRIFAASRITPVATRQILGKLIGRNVCQRVLRLHLLPLNSIADDDVLRVSDSAV